MIFCCQSHLKALLFTQYFMLNTTPETHYHFQCCSRLISKGANSLCVNLATQGVRKLHLPTNSCQVQNAAQPEPTAAHYICTNSHCTVSILSQSQQQCGILTCELHAPAARAVSVLRWVCILYYAGITGRLRVTSDKLKQSHVAINI